MKPNLLDDKGRSEEEFLSTYSPRAYEKPSLSVDILIITKTTPRKVLLIRRKNHPFIAQWALPGGFVNMEESLKDAALRELKEETGVEAVSLSQLHTYGDVHRDPRMRVISVAYLARINDVLQTHANDDAKEASWFRIETTDNYLDFISDTTHIRYEKDTLLVCEGYDALAFDHIQILSDGLQSIEKEN